MLNKDQKQKLFISGRAYSAIGDPANALECGSALHTQISEEKNRLLLAIAKVENSQIFGETLDKLNKKVEYLEEYLKQIEEDNLRLIEIIKENEFSQLNRERYH